MNNRKHHFYIPLGVAILSLIGVLIGIINYWFGPSRGDVMWFCERVHEGFIKQPSNTWSNFGFIISGLYVGWLSYKNKFSRVNLMTVSSFYPVLFACILVFLGPGSMAMHGSNAKWGGFMDLLSMFLMSSFIFSYGLRRMFKLSDAVTAILFVIMVVGSCWVNLNPINGTTPYITLSEWIFALQLVLSFPIELYIKFGHKTNSIMMRGMASVFTMCLAFFIWNISRTSESWFCDPESLIQGHAIWHILNALGGYFLFMFYVTEEYLPTSRQ